MTCAIAAIIAASVFGLMGIHQASYAAAESVYYGSIRTNWQPRCFAIRM